MAQAKTIFRALLSPELLARVMRTLDRTAMVAILVTWIGAVVMMGVALYTVSSAAKARLKTEEAAAVEPIVPQTQRAQVARGELEKLAERLRGRFSKVSFNALPDNTLEITSAEASVYLDWLTALSYLDTIAPQMRWSILDYCVGSECGGNLMRALVVGERVTFKLPELPQGDEAADPAQKS